MPANQTLWPSQLPSTTKASRYRHRPIAYRTDWVSGIVMFLFVLVLLGAVFTGFYLLLGVELHSRIQELIDLLEYHRFL